MEKAVQGTGSLIRDLFREKMACLEPIALDICAPSLPQRKGATCFGIPRFEWPEVTPERKKRAGNAPLALAIRVVMQPIKGCGGPILFADGMDMSGFAQGFDIRCANLRTKDGRRRSPSSKRTIDNSFRGRFDEALWKWFRLGEQRPGPIGKREPRVSSPPDRPSRQNIKHGE